VAVTAPVGCAWTGASNVAWIAVNGPSGGSGNGSLTYSVAPYSGPLWARMGTLDIAGKQFAVTQSR